MTDVAVSQGSVSTLKGSAQGSALFARIGFALAIYLFRATLDLSYVAFLSESFLDDPITPMPLNLDATRVAASYLLLVPIAALLPFDKKDLSGIFFLSAVAFLYVPMTSLIGMNSEKRLDVSIITCLSILLSFAIVKFPMPPWPIPMLNHGFATATTISASFVVLFVVWSVVSGAAFKANLNLSDIYLYREDASATLDPGPMAYLNLWAQKVFNPFLLAVGLFNRKRILVLGCIALQLYFFAVTQHRTHIFVPVLVIFVYVLYTRPFSIANIYNLMSLSILGLLVASLQFDLEEALAILVRRAFFVAPSVAHDWIDFFQVNPHVYFADNILKDVISNSYTAENLPSLMSQLIFDGVAFGFNVGLVGAGFAQLGLAGVALYATTLGLIVRFLNEMIARGLPAFLAAAVLFEPLRTAWADSDLLTAILSHGIFIGTALMWVHGCGTATVQRGPLPQVGIRKT
jgi:hypothetical protein